MAKCGVIGKMKKEIDILTFSDVLDSIGDSTQTWVVSDTVWAWIKPKKRNPSLDGDNVKNQITHEIVIRKNDTLGTNERLRYGSRYFFIKNHLNMDEDDRFTLIEALESSEAEVSV